jgi:hypothetical protein
VPDAAALWSDLHPRTCKPAHPRAAGRRGARPPQIREQRRREVGKLGAIIPYYTGTVALMTASPILASVAAFTAYAFIAPATDFSPARIFSSLALFSLLKPALEGLPFVFVEVRAAAPPCRPRRPGAGHGAWHASVPFTSALPGPL